MQRVGVHTSQRDYQVLIGAGALADVGSALRELLSPGKAVVCTDENVAPHYLGSVGDGLRAAGFETSEVVLPAGEGQKSLARAEELYGVLYERGVRRSDCVVALGGGVIGDLAGFVAATFQRGLHFVQCPTTLLAQVDAAVGGKVGVDFRAGKNYVGSFYQPRLVVADPAALATLPAREVRNGMAEVVKYAYLVGGVLLEHVEAMAATGAVPDEAVVADCVRFKARIVAADERDETGERQLLNLGHTVGHAIEAAAGFGGYSHGEAVALGLRAMLWLSRRRVGLPAPEAERGQRLLDAAGLPVRLERCNVDTVVRLIERDKKATHGGVDYVLLEAFGRPVRGVRVDAGLAREVVTWLAKG
jgi:3-dehydroquinate synthase